MLGKLTTEERTLAVKKLMSESLLNYTFRGTTLSYEELIIAIEYMIVDKITTISNLTKKDMTRARRWKL